MAMAPRHEVKKARPKKSLSQKNGKKVGLWVSTAGGYAGGKAAASSSQGGTSRMLSRRSALLVCLCLLFCSVECKKNTRETEAAESDADSSGSVKKGEDNVARGSRKGGGKAARWKGESEQVVKGRSRDGQGMVKRVSSKM